MGSLRDATCRFADDQPVRWRRLPVFLAGLIALTGQAGEWNRFRGPNGSGVASDAQPPVAPGASNLAWRVAVPRGLSSPTISRGRLFITGVADDRLETLAFSVADGRLLWRRQAPNVTLEPVHQINSPATPSACADDRRVVVYFGSFGLLCYDHDGNELWAKAIPTPRSLYGSASSPILHGEAVILVLDSDANLPDSQLSQSRLIAVHQETGVLIWETARPLMRSGWSTPAIWQHSGGEELIVFGSGRVHSYDPATGVEKWLVSGFARETIGVPVFDGNQAFVASAMGGIADDRTDPEPLWQAMLHFDADKDGQVTREEITEHFTFPLRPEVPPGHPGFGLPLPSDPERRREAQHRHFDGIDRNRDGRWTREEFHANLGPRPFKPRLVAIGAGGRGDVSDSHVTWELARNVPEIPSPLAHEHRLYLVRNGGLLAVINTGDGSVLYQERLGAGGQYSASPVLANQHLYLISNLGVMSVVKSGDQFELVHQHDLGEATFVTPALERDSIYIRTQAGLLAFRRR